ncbi:hypothetical protein JCM3774_005824 [Rhodotorula dairenensis]
MVRSPEPQLVAVPDHERDPNRTADSGSGSDGDDSEEEVFEVEAIHASRYDPDSGAMRYLIKWKGYPDSEKTWEPLENLSNCSEALRKYEKMKAEREAKLAARQAKAKAKARAEARAKASARTPQDDNSDGDDAADQGVSMKELDARRAEAKERAKAKRRASAPARSEDLVAEKWEQKANKEVKKPRASTSSVPATTKRKAASPPMTSSREAKKRSGTLPTNKASRSPKKLPQIVDSDSDEADLGPSAGANAVSRATPALPANAAPPLSANGAGPAQPVITIASQFGQLVDDASTAAFAQQTLPPASTINPLASLLNRSMGTAPLPNHAVLPPKSAVPNTNNAVPPADNAKPPPKNAVPLPKDVVSHTSKPSAPAVTQDAAPKRAQGPWANPQLGDLFSRYKTKPPALPAAAVAASSVEETHGSRVRFAANPVLSNGAGRPAGRSMSPPVRAPSALKNTSAQSSDRRSASPAPVNQAYANGSGASSAAMVATGPRPNGVHITTSAPNGTASETSEGTPGASPQAIAAAPNGSMSTKSSAATELNEEEQRTTRLRAMEVRLKGSSWYQSNPMFREDNLLVACAEAVAMDPTLILRLRGKSVAILYAANLDERVSGEGLALSYLLLATGLRTPTKLSDLDALFLHREEPPEKLEGLYSELVNLDRPVEFFSFGNGEPTAPILGSGYLVLPTLSALRLGAAFERYCVATAHVFGRTCLTAVHPASIARARSLPNWYRIVESIVGQSVSMIDKNELRINSKFVTTESTTLLFPGLVPPFPLPQITADEEISELIEHLRFARAKSLPTWRRFVMVVAESTPDLEERARNFGIEIHTWTSLGTYVAAHPFG